MHHDPKINLNLPHRVRFTRDAFDSDNTTLADVFEIDLNGAYSLVGTTSLVHATGLLGIVF